jgi:HK97 family phage major capsid protein
MDDMVFARRLGKVISVPNAASLGVPALDNDPVLPDWTSEIKTGSEDSTMDFDKRMLYPHPLAERIKVSKKLLRVARMNVASVVNERLSYRFAIKEENGFLNGTGVNQPLGVFTASANGINTGRDVSTGNTTTAIKADNLIECKYTLKAQYRNRARWAFHRDAIKKIRKLKDGEGQYLWKQGLSDRPDTILEMPFEESEYVPNTFTTGNYVGILGDWSFYWIADALNMNVQVLTELYAETNQNGYIARKETDGMPVLEEAFVRVTLA